MDEVEKEFFKSQELKHFSWICYTDDILKHGQGTVEVVEMADVKSVKRKRLLIYLIVILLKKVTKSTTDLIVMKSALPISLAVGHVVRYIRVRLLTVLDIGRTMIKSKQENLRSDDMEIVKEIFLQSHFL